MASYYLLGAALAAGVVEGSSVLALTKKVESGASTEAEGRTYDLVIPSILYGCSCMPLSVVGGSPGPSIVSFLLKIPPPVVVPSSVTMPGNLNSRTEMGSPRIWNAGRFDLSHSENATASGGVQRQRRMKLPALLYWNDTGSVRAPSEGESTEESRGILTRDTNCKRRPKQPMHMIRKDREDVDDFPEFSSPSATTVTGANSSPVGATSSVERTSRLQRPTQTQPPTQKVGSHQFISGLHHPTLPTPLAEAMRRLRLVLVGFAAVGAWVGHLSQKQEEQQEKEKKEQRLRRTGRSVPAVLHHVQATSNDGVVLRLVRNTKELRSPAHRENKNIDKLRISSHLKDPSASSSQTASSILYVLCDGWDGSKDWQYGEASSDSDAVFQHRPFWRLGQTAEEWNAIPMTENWLLSGPSAVAIDGPGSKETGAGHKCQHRQRYLWIEADVSLSLYAELCGYAKDNGSSLQDKTMAERNGESETSKQKRNRKSAEARTAANLLSAVAHQKGIVGKVGSIPKAVVDDSLATSITVSFGGGRGWPVNRHGERWWSRKGNEIFIDSRSCMASAIRSAVENAQQLSRTSEEGQSVALEVAEDRSNPVDQQESSVTGKTKGEDLPPEMKNTSNSLSQQTGILAVFDSVGRAIRDGGKWLGDTLETTGATIRLMITRFSERPSMSTDTSATPQTLKPSATQEKAPKSSCREAEADKDAVSISKNERRQTSTSQSGNRHSKDQTIHVVSPSEDIAKWIYREVGKCSDDSVQWKVERHDMESELPQIGDCHWDDSLLLICGTDDNSTIDFVCSITRDLPRVIVLLETKESMQILRSLLHLTSLAEKRGNQERHKDRTLYSADIICLEEVRDESFEKVRLWYRNHTAKD